MLQNTLDTTQSRNNVNTVVVELPKLPVVTLRCPPEWVAGSILVSLGTRIDSGKLTVLIVDTASSQCALSNHGHMRAYKTINTECNTAMTNTYV